MWKCERRAWDEAQQRGGGRAAAARRPPTPRSPTLPLQPLASPSPSPDTAQMKIASTLSYSQTAANQARQPPPPR